MLKIKNITKKVGFTKEQQTNMAELILNEINKNANIKEISRVIKEDFKNDFKAVYRDKEYKVINLFIDGIPKEENKQIKKALKTALYNGAITSEEYMEERQKAQQTQKEEFTINVINSKCKYTLYYDFKVFIEFLRRCGVSVTVKEKEEKEEKIEHKNAVTGHIYSGNNAELLTRAMYKNNYKKPEWVASGQAKKIKKQIKENAEGVTIRIFYTDDDGRQFCKLETVYNIDELEEIKKIETSSGYIDMINRLKAV